MGDRVSGHEPLPQRINVRNEIRRLAQDPMRQFLDTVQPERTVMIQNAAVRYEEAYRCFYLSVKRYLPAMSLAIRWHNGPRWALRYGDKYTPSERKVADRYNEVAPYLDLDFYACLLWARILLDRTISLSRYFIEEPERPSFTSFNQHRRFFLRQSMPYGRHEAYAAYFREETGWFEEPLKLVRDKFVVHASPAHGKFLAFPGPGNELSLTIFIAEDSEKPLDKVRLLQIGIPQLAREVHEFLSWYADYAQAALKRASE